jgi:hypothetical protein
MSFKFTYTSISRPEVEVIVSTKAVTLHEVLQAFEDFLKGSGFYLKGTLDIVEEYPHEEMSADEIDWHAASEIARLTETNEQLELTTSQLQKELEELKEFNVKPEVQQ